MLSLALTAAPLTAQAATPAEAALADLSNVSFPAPHRVARGHQQLADIAALKRAGIEQVINLGVGSETPDFDQAAAMRAAGIGYHTLPVHGATDLTHARIIEFSQLLNDAGHQHTLVRCVSSNRVGTMIALQAALVDGQSIKASLNEGRRRGLKSLQPTMQERLQTWPDDAPDHVSRAGH